MHSKFSEVNGRSHEDVPAIRDGKFPRDKSIGDLVWTTRTILEKRGHLTDKDLEIIENMGINRAKVYEILAHIGRKMIANYAVHIIKPDWMMCFDLKNNEKKRCAGEPAQIVNLQTSIG